MTGRFPRGRGWLIGAASTALAAAPMAAASPLASAAPSSSGPKGAYIVQVTGVPIASYTGDKSGLSRTKPGKGKKVNRSSAAAKKYGKHLRAKHEKVLKSVGGSPSAVTHDYDLAFNGFAAKLTAQQVRSLKKSPDVVRVWKDEKRSSTTTSTPKFLGMTGKQGVWKQKFGGSKNAGRGMIVGVVDSGIWPEHPSFAATSQTKKEAQTIADKWKGTCQAGEEAPKVRCNNKLIGAQYFNDNATVIPEEFTSPRDYGGHGSHTSSTAAGNHGVKAEINESKLGTMSGMAPHARVAMYKALWERADHTGSSGSTSDLVAAIDTAVGDGVDVISYSISGSQEYVVSPDELAFLSAADAGVFVATSAGNSGDTIGASSVAHNSPWTTTVASSTHDRGASKTVTLGDGKKYEGVGVQEGVGPKPIVNGKDIAAKGAPAKAAQYCFEDADPDADGAQPALDPAKAKGKIVVCTRGENDRVAKSAAVKTAGGGGMVMANTTKAESLDADFHAVPSIHVGPDAGTAIAKYAESDGATATISEVDTSTVRAPEMSGFSSYGPATAAGGDLLKPDITAPGSGVIAAVAPPGNDDQLFGAYSGTSMSTPHIAGIAALVKQKHPTWSPAAVKSALMTTATTKDNKDKPIQRAGKDATPLDYGSGHVRAKESFNPGLVYDAGYSDWLKYACGIGQLQLVTSESTCKTVGSTDPSDLNYPTISVGDLAASQTVKRTVTNVEKKATQYTAEVKAPPGFTATVTPRKLTVPPGQSRSFEVTLTRTTAEFGKWSFGSLTWNGKRGQEVTSPISARPVALSAPDEVTGEGASGSDEVPVTPGYTGTLETSVAGLVPSTVATKDATPSKAASFEVTVPKGTKVARFGTYDKDYTATDLDMEVTKGDDVVGTSAGGTAEEAVTVRNPEAGTYTVTVELYSGPDTVPVKLNSFLVGSKDEGNLTVKPASQKASAGTETKVTAAWSALKSGERYLGLLEYGDGSTTRGSTLVSVTP